MPRVEEEKQENSAASERSEIAVTSEPETKPVTWKRRLLSWSWQLIVILLLYIVVISWMTSSLLAYGKTAPHFALKDLKGKTHSLQQYRGKQIVLHFWATWCGVCKTNMPVLKWMASAYQKDPVLLSVVQDSHNLKKIREIQRAKGISYPILLATRAMLKSYRVSQFPTTYFIDKHGRVFSKDVGFITPFGFWWRSWISSIKTWLGK